MTSDEIFTKWAADIRRRTFKDGQEMPLALLALGLCGEAAEVAEAIFDTDEALKLELGDCEWYALAIAQHSDCAGPPINEIAELPRDTLSNRVALMTFAGKAADRIKKHAWHGKPLDLAALAAELVALCDVLWTIGDARGISREDVALANMAKLDARYPGGKFVEGGGVRADDAAAKGRSLPDVRR